MKLIKPICSGVSTIVQGLFICSHYPISVFKVVCVLLLLACAGNTELRLYDKYDLVDELVWTMIERIGLEVHIAGTSSTANGVLLITWKE